uniref:Chromo domain-containing protein n=1 Tax=Eutreptiella gymnastica TaxID=73025 RepID=A0A7S4CSJ1_9EUGL
MPFNPQVVIEDDDEFEEGDEGLDMEMLSRDETMNAMMVQTEGLLQELDALGAWYDEAVRDAQAYMQHQMGDELDVMEEVCKVSSGELMYRDESGFSNASDEWVIEKILQRKRYQGEQYYLVKWKGYASPSWELEQDLDSQGYGGWLEKFVVEAAVRCREQGAAKVLQPTEEKQCRVPRSEPFRVAGPGEFSPEIYWHNFQLRIAEAFKQAGACVSRIQNIVDPSRSRTFMCRWMKSRQHDKAAVPVMLFHCTPNHNIPGIVKNGLVVPGTGHNVTVANGSAYGVGIYTARSPLTGFCRGGNYAFVCAGLVGPRFLGTADHGSIVVFFDPDTVLPCFLVEIHTCTYGNKCAGQPQYVSQLYKPNMWPPSDRGYHHPSHVQGSAGPVSNVQKYYPVIPKVEGDEGNWADHAMAKPISKKQLKRCAKRVKMLYKQGQLKQVRNKR